MVGLVWFVGFFKKNEREISLPVLHLERTRWSTSRTATAWLPISGNKQLLVMGRLSPMVSINIIDEQAIADQISFSSSVLSTTVIFFSSSEENAEQSWVY